MKDTTVAAATLAENDRQAAELARYVEHKDEVMRALRAAVVGLRASDLPRSAAAIASLLRDIEGTPEPQMFDHSATPLTRYPPIKPSETHDVDECEDRECAVCAEYHAGRDDGGTCMDEDSRYAPLIDPQKERAKLAQRETP